MESISADTGLSRFWRHGKGILGFHYALFGRQKRCFYLINARKYWKVAGPVRKHTFGPAVEGKREGRVRLEYRSIQRGAFAPRSRSFMPVLLDQNIKLPAFGPFEAGLVGWLIAGILDIGTVVRDLTRQQRMSLHLSSTIIVILICECM